jgi:dienelactone hydrolase
MKRGIVIAAVVAVAMACAGQASAATPLTTDWQASPCPAYGGIQICSGEVPSFDGSKLDVDLSLPAPNSAGPHPLIVLLHGFGNNKHEWESVNDEGDGADKWHWNSHWFAEHGYYVLTYTARGFRDDGPDASFEPDTPSDSSGSVDLPNGTLHLKSREFEIRDTQWLAALVAYTYPDVARDQIAVSGGSYGGGESWLQAAQPTWTFPNSQDSDLPVLQLQVAVPKYPWTDLSYSLAPSGHGGGPSGTDLYESSTGHPDSDTGSGFPIGVLKFSYVTGLSALGAEKGVYEAGTTTTPSEEGPIDIPAWNARSTGGGDPYDVAGAEDPAVAQIRRGLSEFRSSYYQDEQWQAQVGQRKVAVFDIQGWTDDLFPAVEAFRQFKYLKRLDPRWPVEVAVADVGHSRAQNKPATWHPLNDQAWQWLQSNINGSNDQETTVSSFQTTCANDGDADSNTNAQAAITSTSPEGLSAGSLTVDYANGGNLDSTSGSTDPNGPGTDPIVGDVVDSAFGNTGPCRTAEGPAAGAYTAESDPLPNGSTFVGIGHVKVPYTFAGTTGTLLARVWDVVPGGPTVLVTRGAYRIDTPAYDSAAGTLRLPLFGNDWYFAPGHRIRLDLLQVDNPTFRPSNVPSSITFGPPSLVLPTREAQTEDVPGS